MSHPEYGPWLTPGLVARLIALHADKKLFSYAQIANKLSKEFKLELPRNAIVGKIYRLGLERRPARVYPKKEKQVKLRFPGPPKEPSPPPPPDPIIIGKVTFAQLEHEHCKWPHGDSPNVTFCGEPREYGRPYCYDHNNKAWGRR